jgi:hypothetical protein|nr:MAG TPA: tail protein [Caudoviricetes sp.]
MIRTIVLTNPGGETLALDLFEPWNTGIAVKNVDGLGPGKADINTTDLALTDSALFNGSRVQKRTISLTLVPMETPTQDVEQSRQKIYRFCQIKRPVRITVYADHRQVYTDGYVESSEPDIWSNLESHKISILCPYGYWYDNRDDASDLINFDVEEPSFEFSWEDPLPDSPALEFSRTLSDKTAVVNYEGDVEAGFLLRIKILKANPLPITLTETVWQQTMKLTGKWTPSATAYQPSVGDTIEVDTRVGRKGIYLEKPNGTRYKGMYFLDFNSDWLLMHPGRNEFHYAMSDKTAVDIRFTTDITYQGV